MTLSDVSAKDSRVPDAIYIRCGADGQVLGDAGL
jgi:hypothetical protein